MGGKPRLPSWLKNVDSPVHYGGNIWNIELSGYGRTLVGPYSELEKVVSAHGLGEETHHIVAEEHLRDIRTRYTRSNAPAVAVDKKFHQDILSSRIGAEQKYLGGRAQRFKRRGFEQVKPSDKTGRAVVSRVEVRELYQEVYRFHTGLDELADITDNILLEPVRPRPSGGGLKKAQAAFRGSKTGVRATDDAAKATANKLTDPAPARIPDAGATPDTPAPTRKAAALPGPPSRVASGFRRTARLSIKTAAGVAKLAGLTIPDPTDVVFLLLDYFAAYEAARQEIRDRNIRFGFSAGLASALFGMPRGFVRNEIQMHGQSKDVALNILGAVGIPEASYNRGVKEGYKFGLGLSLEQMDVLQKIGFRALAQSGYQTKNLFEARTIVKFGHALLPTIDHMFEKARLAREKREREELAERNRVMRSTRLEEHSLSRQGAINKGSSVIHR